MISSTRIIRSESNGRLWGSGGATWAFTGSNPWLNGPWSETETSASVSESAAPSKNPETTSSPQATTSNSHALTSVSQTSSSASHTPSSASQTSMPLQSSGIPEPNSGPVTSESRELPAGVIAGIVVGSILVALVVLSVVIVLLRRRSRAQSTTTSPPSQNPNPHSNNSVYPFDLKYPSFENSLSGGASAVPNAKSASPFRVAVPPLSIPRTERQVPLQSEAEQLHTRMASIQNSNDEMRATVGTIAAQLRRIEAESDWVRGPTDDAPPEYGS